jgi:hypothetical protein
MREKGRKGEREREGEIGFERTSAGEGFIATTLFIIHDRTRLAEAGKGNWRLPSHVLLHHDHYTHTHRRKSAPYPDGFFHYTSQKEKGEIAQRQLAGSSTVFSVGYADVSARKKKVNMTAPCSAGSSQKSVDGNVIFLLSLSYI